MSLKNYNQKLSHKREIRDKREIRTSPGLVALMILCGGLMGAGHITTLRVVAPRVANSILETMDSKGYENDFIERWMIPRQLEPYSPDYINPNPFGFEMPREYESI